MDSLNVRSYPAAPLVAIRGSLNTDPLRHPGDNTQEDQFLHNTVSTLWDCLHAKTLCIPNPENTILSGKITRGSAVLSKPLIPGWENFMGVPSGAALVPRIQGGFDLNAMAAFLNRWNPTREDRNRCRSLLRARRLCVHVDLIDEIGPLLRGPLRCGRISREGVALLLRMVGTLTWRQVVLLSAWSASGFVVRRAAAMSFVAPSSFSEVLSAARRRLHRHINGAPARALSPCRCDAGSDFRTFSSPLRRRDLELSAANS